MPTNRTESAFINTLSPTDIYGNPEANEVLSITTTTTTTSSTSYQPESGVLVPNGTTGPAVAHMLFIGVFLALVIFLSVVGNLLVCAAIYTDRSLRKIGNLFIVSLAIADLFVATLVETFAVANDIMGYWVFGHQFCDTWTAFDVMCCTASILNLCAISLDRYIHIRDPLRYTQWMTKRVIVASIAGIWLVSALISFLPMSLGLHKPLNPLPQSPDGPTCALDFTPTYAIVSSMISFFVPCVVMVGLYSRLYAYARMHVKNIKAVTKPPAASYRPPPPPPVNNSLAATPTMTVVPIKVHSTCRNGHHHRTKDTDSECAAGSCCSSSSRSSSSSSSSSSHLQGPPATTALTPVPVTTPTLPPLPPVQQPTPAHHVSDHKAAVTLGIIVGVFLFCWVPFFCVNITAAFCKTCIPDMVFKVLTWIGYLNSALNPIIYSIFSKDFRAAFRRILTGHARGCNCACCYGHRNYYPSVAPVPVRVDGGAVGGALSRLRLKFSSASGRTRVRRVAVPNNSAGSSVTKALVRQEVPINHAHSNGRFSNIMAAEKDSNV